MATICSICKDKIGALSTFSTWTPERTDLPVCNDCKERFLLAQRTDIDPENKIVLHHQREAVGYLLRKREKEDIDPAIASAIDALPSVESVKKKEREGEAIRAERAERRSSFITTTGFDVEGYKVTRHFGVISTDAIVGTGILADTASAFSDLTGSKSNSLAEKMRSVKSDALYALIDEAVSREANALIGCSFIPYVVNGNMMAVSVTGTAVRIERLIQKD